MIKEVIKLKLEFIEIFYKKGVLSVILCLLLGLGGVYLLLPGPQSIADFPALPHSTKSQLEGDTIQNPNIAAYFSNSNREDITEFYWKYFSHWNYGFLTLPLLKINHPPEFAYTYIRDQQESTGLEEYFRPMRESLFVNINDALIYSQIRQRPLSFDSTHLEYNGEYFSSKGTIRYFSSNPLVRVIVLILIFEATFLFTRLVLYFRKVYR